MNEKKKSDCASFGGVSFSIDIERLRRKAIEEYLIKNKLIPEKALNIMSTEELREKME